MSDLHTANSNGSLPTNEVAVEPNPQQSDIRPFTVKVVADAHLTFTADEQVYAESEKEAIAKVEAKLEDERLSHLTFEDLDCGATAGYDDLKWADCVEFWIDSAERNDLDEITEEEVLRADVEELEDRISWDTDALKKQKAFLETLLPSVSEAA